MENPEYNYIIPLTFKMSLSEINKLICFQQCLEKSISSTFYYLRKLPECEDILELNSALEKKRFEEKNALQLESKQVIANINAKIQFLKINNSLSSSDLKQFKNEMILIQDSIQNIKISSKLKLKSLYIDYVDVSQDVDYYAGKMFEWSEPINVKNLLNIKLDYKRQNNDLKCVEIREFIDFVRKSGGHENGWDKDDHQLFIKIRNKYKVIDIVCQKINEILPDKRAEDVKKHDEWYKQYLILKQNKQDALKRWQESKRKKFVPVSVEEETPKVNKIFTKEDLKEKLKKWQLEKESKMRDHLLIDELKEQRKRELDNMRKKKNEQIKLAVREWKAIKLSLEQENIVKKKLVEDQEKKKASAEANKLIKQFQAQDDYYILKIRQQKKRKEISLPVRSKSSQIATRDPKRILKPTRQWINRVHDENVYPKEGVIPLKKLPKLRIPDWRKNTDEF